MRPAFDSVSGSSADMQAARADRPPVVKVAAVCSARYSAPPVWLAWTTSQSASPVAVALRAPARARQNAKHIAR